MASGFISRAERYLLSIFATTPAAQDPRRQRLIADFLADFIRLSAKNE